MVRRWYGFYLFSSNATDMPEQRLAAAEESGDKELATVCFKIGAKRGEVRDVT